LQTEKCVSLSLSLSLSLCASLSRVILSQWWFSSCFEKSLEIVAPLILFQRFSTSFAATWRMCIFPPPYASSMIFLMFWEDSESKSGSYSLPFSMILLTYICCNLKNVSVSSSCYFNDFLHSFEKSFESESGCSSHPFWMFFLIFWEEFWISSTVYEIWFFLMVDLGMADKDGIGDCKGREIEACSCGGSLPPSSFETHSWH
jgi:hypothetical protein